MGFLYEIGPTLMGVVAALLITGYCWSRVRLASLLVPVGLGERKESYMSLWPLGRRTPELSYGTSP